MKPMIDAAVRPAHSLAAALGLLLMVMGAGLFFVLHLLHPTSGRPRRRAA
jgi:hypothetical protein